MAKTYTLRETYKGREYIHEGTLSDLINVFKYRLECNGVDTDRIRTVNSLLKHLNSGQDYWSMNASYSIL